MLFVIRSGGAGPRGRTPEATVRDASIGRGHYVCGVLGLGTALLAVFLAYSVLVAVASLVPLLSTTTIAFVGVVTWVVLWVALDAVRVRFRRRTTA